MTKKHFIQIADDIKTARRIDPDYFSREELTVLADTFRRINPRFDHARWIGYIEGRNGPSGGAI